MDRVKGLAWAALFIFSLAMLFPGAAQAEIAPLMGIKELKDRLGDGKTIIIDVRRQGDFEAGQTKIKGAVREDWAKPSKWASKYDKEANLVFYCA